MGDSLEENWSSERGSKGKKKGNKANKQDQRSEKSLNPGGKPSLKRKKPEPQEEGSDNEDGGAIYDFENDEPVDQDKPKQESREKQEKRRNKRQKMNEKLKERRSPLILLGDLTKAGKEEQASFFLQSYKNAFPDQTALEIEEFQIKAEHVEIYSEPHTPENLPKFLKKIFPNWKKDLGIGKKGEKAEMGEKGSPWLVVVCPSAIRAVEVIRFLHEFHELCKIGKMFAKHFKIEEQEKILREEAFKIVVGTPNRLEKLNEIGALKTERVRHVVVDMFVDSKQKTIFEIPEVRKDLFSFLKTCCSPRMNEGKLKISLF